MRELTERACFVVCLAVGRLLGAARYSTARVVEEHGQRRVEKSRRFYAPILVWMGGPLVKLLDTGVRVLDQRDWEERECVIHARLDRPPVRLAGGGTLLLPYMPGRTLAALLEDQDVPEPTRTRAIERATLALARFHGLGLTHADAMAANVLIDLDTGCARWFDFETVHDPDRPMAWRRADDLRALLVTCLVRMPPGQLASTLDLVLDTYADAEVTRALARSFSPIVQRPLAFHLAQAALPIRSYQEVARLLQRRLAG